MCTHTLCTEVLPAPADVAAASLTVLAAHPSASTKLERPILSKWNETLEEGLDAYTRAGAETAGIMRQVTSNASDAALHHHTAADAVPGTITLCATAPEDDAVRWTHLTVNASQWQDFSHLREWARVRVRYQLGDDQAPIRLLVLDDAGLISEAADSGGTGRDGTVNG